MDDFTCPSVRYLTLSVFWVSLLGIPKSLVIWVRGYPKHGDTQIIVTPAVSQAVLPKRFDNSLFLCSEKNIKTILKFLYLCLFLTFNARILSGGSFFGVKLTAINPSVFLNNECLH